MTSDAASDPVGGGVAATLRRRLPLLVVLAVSAALQARMWRLVWHYSVNVLFYAKGAGPPEALEEKLLYLKRNRLNLFSGD